MSTPTTLCGVACPDHPHTCARSPQHYGHHRDVKQKGDETCSWPDPPTPRPAGPSVTDTRPAAREALRGLTGGHPTPQWRTVWTDDERLTDIGPVCEDPDHEPTDGSIYDCCPSPVIEVDDAALAAYLVALLNADREAAGGEVRREVLHEAAAELDRIAEHYGPSAQVLRDAAGTVRYMARKDIGDGTQPPTDESTQPAAEPLAIRWDRTVIHPDAPNGFPSGETIVCCLADDGRPVALFLDDEHREALGLMLVDPDAEAEQAAPDFFQPDHTYARRDGVTFTCVALTTHPQSGERRAFGWLLYNGWPIADTLDPDDWTDGGWTEATTDGAS